MKHEIKIELIDPNPHRDLVNNPIKQEQIDALVGSIERTGFWNNVVVRPHPAIPGRYELGHGHTRMAALRQMRVESAVFEVGEFTDYDMLDLMFDENDKQKGSDADVVIEHLTAALKLGERMLGECATAAEFNALLKKSHRPHGDDLNFSEWREQEFGRAKECLESGEGLGKDFIKHFLHGRPVKNDTAQNVIDGYYAESRRAAYARRLEEERRMAEEQAKAEAEAKARAEAELKAQQEAELEAAALEAERIAKEQAAQAEADAARKAALEAEAAKAKAQAAQAAKAQKERAAKADKAVKAAGKAEKARKDAEDAARKTKAKADRAEYAGIDLALLKRLKTTGPMNMAAAVIKREKIPVEWHERFIDAVIREEWNASRTPSGAHANSIEVMGAFWWDLVSPDRVREREKDAARAKKAKEVEKIRTYVPFSHFVEAVAKALGNTTKLEVALESGDFSNHNPDDMEQQAARLEGYGRKLIELAGIVRSTSEPRFIDIDASRADDITTTYQIEHQEA